MRVLHVISDLKAAAGGVTSAVAGLATAQQRAAGLDVTILATFLGEADRGLIERLTAAGVALRLVGPAAGRLVRHPDLSRATSEAVASADIVHVAGLWEAIQHSAAVAARGRGIPYLFSPHGMLDPWSLARRKWIKRLYMVWRLREDLDRAAAIHYTCEVERDLVQPLRLHAPPIIEPNGLDLSEFQSLPSPDVFRARHRQLAGGKPFVLFLSRIDPKKGLDLLVPAFARLQKTDALLVIAGPDLVNYQAEVQRLASDQGIADRVLFTGMLRGTERIEALAAATLFVLPSYQENFGIAVIEALAAGVPVVISDQVNIHAEIAAAGVGGVVPTQIEALAGEMQRWLTDPALYEAAKDRAPAFARDHYDWRQIAQRWKERYAELKA
jgi:glycosyltransferase involved in cell wall biosynthesis